MIRKTFDLNFVLFVAKERFFNFCIVLSLKLEIS